MLDGLAVRHFFVGVGNIDEHFILCLNIGHVFNGERDIVVHDAEQTEAEEKEEDEELVEI